MRFTDKDLCCSQFLALRYVVEDNIDFFQDLTRRKKKTVKNCKIVFTPDDIDFVIRNNLEKIANKKCGLMLSGGMDSAILASYLQGRDAYTFRFEKGFAEDELKRAEFFANYYNLNLHYVDIDWKDVEKYLPIVIKGKGAPVHSIEPQIYKASIQALNDGIETIVIGNASDYIFGGMNQLLSKDWGYDEFIDRYTYINPQNVLINSRNIKYLFEKYKRNDKIAFLQVMDELAIEESYSSYDNAFKCAGIEYVDLYENMKLGNLLDLNRIRNGESKYLIRELFKSKYPNIPVPEKVPMPRPVDKYFANYEGPTRKEFYQDLNMNEFTGNQKWLIWCLEKFLDMYDNGELY